LTTKEEKGRRRQRKKENTKEGKRKPRYQEIHYLQEMERRRKGSQPRKKGRGTRRG
jgi:hypothetical protein